MISWAFVRVSSRVFCLCYRGVFFVVVRYHDFLLGVGFLLGFKWRGLGDIWRHTIGGQSVFIPTKTKRHFKKFRKKQKGGYSRLEFRIVFYLYILGHFGQLEFYRDYYNYLSLFMAALCVIYVLFETSALTIHLVKPWSIWSTVWSHCG